MTGPSVYFTPIVSTCLVFFKLGGVHVSLTSSVEHISLSMDIHMSSCTSWFLQFLSTPCFIPIVCCMTKLKSFISVCQHIAGYHSFSLCTTYIHVLWCYASAELVGGHSAMKVVSNLLKGAPQGSPACFGCNTYRNELLMTINTSAPPCNLTVHAHHFRMRSRLLF